MTPSGPEGTDSRRPTIALFTSAELGEASGPTIHVISLANALARVMDVTLVVHRPSGTPVLAISPEVTLLHVPSPRRWRLPGALAFLAMVPHLARLRGRDVVLVRSAPGSAILSLAAIVVRVKRLAVELNGWIAGETPASRRGRMFGSLLGWLQGVEARRADVIRTVTPELKACLVAAGVRGERIHVIENGGQLDIFRPLDRLACRRRLGLAETGPRAVFIGNLWGAIDLDVAIRAVGMLHERGVPLCLTIVGDGPAAAGWREDAKRIAPAGAIHFTGMLNPAEAAIHLGAADIALAPFAPPVAGLSPLKIRDYASGGRCIVASDLPGIRQHAGQEWLFLAKAGDAEAFASGIEQALARMSPELDQAARKFAEEHYSWERIAGRLARILAPGPHR